MRLEYAHSAASLVPPTCDGTAAKFVGTCIEVSLALPTVSIGSSRVAIVLLCGVCNITDLENENERQPAASGASDGPDSLPNSRAGTLGRRSRFSAVARNQSEDTDSLASSGVETADEDALDGLLAKHSRRMRNPSPLLGADMQNLAQIYPSIDFGHKSLGGHKRSVLTLPNAATQLPVLTTPRPTLAVDGVVVVTGSDVESVHGHSEEDRNSVSISLSSVDSTDGGSINERAAALKLFPTFNTLPVPRASSDDERPRTSHSGYRRATEASDSLVVGRGRLAAPELEKPPSPFHATQVSLQCDHAM